MKNEDILRLKKSVVYGKLMLNRFLVAIWEEIRYLLFHQKFNKNKANAGKERGGTLSLGKYEEEKKRLQQERQQEYRELMGKVAPHTKATISTTHI